MLSSNQNRGYSEEGITNMTQVEVDEDVHERVRVMDYVWGRVLTCWAEEELQEARDLSRMYEVLDSMSNEAYEATYCDCTAADL